ncbi:MAG: hypothetical protein Q7S34_02450, partial [bacterium]|nr:hypothetical protein [bacterium]
MISIFYGNDRIKALSAAEKILVKTKADGIVLFDEATINVEELLSLAEQQALFGGTRVVKLDGVLSNEETKEVILKNLESFSKSPTTFIFLEDSLLADEVRQFKKYAE